MSNYLKWDDPAAYEGLGKKAPTFARSFECPKCKGYGGWILRRDAYGEGEHFRAHCDNCGGTGYLTRPSSHIHEWGQGKVVGRCLTEYTCACGARDVVDSSD